MHIQARQYEHGQLSLSDLYSSNLSALHILVSNSASSKVVANDAHKQSPCREIPVLYRQNSMRSNVGSAKYIPRAWEHYSNHIKMYPPTFRYTFQMDNIFYSYTPYSDSKVVISLPPPQSTVEGYSNSIKVSYSSSASSVENTSDAMTDNVKFTSSSTEKESSHRRTQSEPENVSKSTRIYPSRKSLPNMCYTEDASTEEFDEANLNSSDADMLESSYQHQNVNESDNLICLCNLSLPIIEQNKSSEHVLAESLSLLPLIPAKEDGSSDHTMDGCITILLQRLGFHRTLLVVNALLLEEVSVLRT